MPDKPTQAPPDPKGGGKQGPEEGKKPPSEPIEVGPKKCCPRLFEVFTGPVTVADVKVEVKLPSLPLVRWAGLTPVVEWLDLVVPVTVAKDIFRRADFVAVFRTESPCECACCEFRQYVRGSFSINGIPLVHSLSATTVLNPILMQEDGNPEGFRYGHRAVPGIDGNQYLPDQATGCLYLGRDFPGLRWVPLGTAYTIDLHFRCFILDTCRQEVDLNNVRTWSLVTAGVA